jgi:hypothetical protein
MKNIVLVAITCVFFTTAKAQEFFLKAGKNNTAYLFDSPSYVSDVNFRNGFGDFFEVGLTSKIKRSKFSYLVSITSNQFNTKANFGLNTYSWETNYFGLQNQLSYEVFQMYSFHFALVGGLNSSVIIRGSQYTNNVYYDIKRHTEFFGFLLQPQIGAEVKYTLYKSISLGLGYVFSKAFNLSNTTSEKLSFQNSQFRFALYIPLKN